jgi:hypothetical protein
LLHIIASEVLSRAYSASAEVLQRRIYAVNELALSRIGIEGVLILAVVDFLFN